MTRKGDLPINMLMLLVLAVIVLAVVAIAFYLWLGPKGKLPGLVEEQIKIPQVTP